MKDKLNGLWIGKLNEANAWYHIYPLAASELSNHLYIVRHKELEKEIPNSSYHNYNPSLKIINFLKLFFAGRKVIKNYQIDYIVSFSMVPWGIVGFALSRFYRKPFYIGLIGADFNKFYLKSTFKGVIQKMVKSSEVISVTGNAMKEEIIKTGLSSEKLFIFPHCVPSEYFIHKPLLSFDTDIITASSLIPRKQIHLILSALALLKKNNIVISFKILGDGILKPKLESLCEELKIKDQVTFIGYTKNVFHYLRKAKIYIQASKSEGLSLSLIEAIVAGTVPISTIAGSEKDIIIHGKNGLLLEDQTPEAIAQAIELVLNPNTHKQMRKAVLKSRDDFRIEKAIDMSSTIQKFISQRYLTK